jgi:putative NADH-flavin reductase
MKIAVFGATGGTGLAFLDQALAAGHSLRALVRDQTKISETTRANANLELVKGDLLFNAKSVASTLEGCDGLFITLGGRGVPDVCSRGTGIILDAVKEAKMDPKTVAVTSFGVGDSREDANGYLIRFFLWAIIGAAIAGGCGLG